METVRIFGFAQSTYVRTARLVCEEKGISCELVPLDFGSSAHALVHPYLKMPSLQHGEVRLFETLAIVTYLNDEFPGPDLEGSTGIERARMLQWISAANDYLYDGLVSQLVKSDNVETETVDRAKSLLIPIDKTLAGQPFLAGDDLTLADLFLLPMLLFAEKVTNDPQWLSALPDLGGWLDRLRGRPGVMATEG